MEFFPKMHPRIGIPIFLTSIFTAYVFMFFLSNLEKNGLYAIILFDYIFCVVEIGILYKISEEYNENWLKICASINFIMLFPYLITIRRYEERIEKLFIFMNLGRHLILITIEWISIVLEHDYSNDRD